MISGIYSAASAMEIAEIKHEVIANNLANISTVGYKRDEVPFESELRYMATLHKDEEQNIIYVKGTPETILPGATPLEGEPIVKSSVDKFYKTDLEKILKKKGIKTVIIIGTTAEGAVLHTATGASMRGFQVIVPIDGMSAGTLYAEQYTAWHLVNAPGTRRRTTLTRFDMINIEGSP